MDSKALGTCSEAFQNAVTHIELALNKQEPLNIDDAIGFYVLDAVNSKEVARFRNEWPKAVKSQEYITFEVAWTLPYLIRLEKGYVDDKVTSHRGISKILDLVESLQTVNGDLSTEQYSHSYLMWALTLAKPNADSTERAIEYFLQNYKQMRTDATGPDTRLVVGALALFDLNHKKYSEELSDIESLVFQQIEEGIHAVTEDTSATSQSPAEYIEFMSRSRENKIGEINNIVNQIKESQKEEGYWNIEEPAKFSSTGALALLNAGEGPKTPEQHVKWGQTKADQKERLLIPQFQRTYPARANATHITEIRDQVARMIKSSSETLRVSSLYIDMLYEEIIKLLHKNPEIEVKIITRGSDVKGNRRRIKKGVLNELIQATEGNVRGNRLLHSRMIISDKSSLLVSSADLTRDQLMDEFNAGIFTHEKQAVDDAISYFESVWEESNPLDIN